MGAFLQLRMMMMGVRVLSIALLLLGPALTAQAHETDSATRDESHSAASRDSIDAFSDPEQADAAQLASSVGITLEEAVSQLGRRPRVGDLRDALEDQGPSSFDGMFLDYGPDYKITLLANPGGGTEVRQAVTDLGFVELSPFAVVRETPYTETVLENTLVQVSELLGSRATTLGFDIRTGEIIATTSSSDLESVQMLVASRERAMLASRILVLEGGAYDQHSYGGLGLFFGGGHSPCTTGFTVRSTTNGAEGVATAGHCAADNGHLSHHSVTFNHIDGKNRDSQDVQWHGTPGLDDLKQIKWLNDGTTRTISSRKDRSDMEIGDQVCKYGRSSGYGCGYIRMRSFDPDGGENRFNPTFIQMRDVDTDNTDSGGPWFHGSKAFGIHKGATFGGGGVPSYPFFMAQNFMGALDIQVQISP
jgi:streptogrisin C